jgi:hypothetical protein
MVAHARVKNKKKLKYHDKETSFAISWYTKIKIC